LKQDRTLIQWVSVEARYIHFKKEGGGLGGDRAPSPTNHCSLLFALSSDLS
jgi:hypothetical protein